MKGRLLELTAPDPYSNLALEEALFIETKTPTLRVWENQRSVVIGRGQLAAYETDVGYCNSHSVPVARRFTAGGAVYNGPGNVNWSFFIPSGGGAYGGAKGIFAAFARVVVGALAQCGVSCEFTPPNGISVPLGKVCGMAAYIARDSLLCHGTLLCSADVAEVERLTKPMGLSLPRRYPRSRFVRVANCGVHPARFVKELSSASPFRVEDGSLTSEERIRADSLQAKYRSSGWNLGDPFARDDF